MVTQILSSLDLRLIKRNDTLSSPLYQPFNNNDTDGIIQSDPDFGNLSHNKLQRKKTKFKFPIQRLIIKGAI